MNAVEAASAVSKGEKLNLLPWPKPVCVSLRNSFLLPEVRGHKKGGGSV